MNRSPLRHWAYLTHQLLSSCVISVGRYLRTQGEVRETSFLFQRCSVLVQRFNAILLHDSLPAYELMTAPIDFSYLFSYFFQ